MLAELLLCERQQTYERWDDSRGVDHVPERHCNKGHSFFVSGCARSIRLSSVSLVPF